MIRIPVLIFIPIFCYCLQLSAQIPAHRPGEFLVSLADGTSPSMLAQRLDAGASAERVATLLNTWLIRSSLPERATLDWLRRQPEVRAAQYNHLLENRGLPNDPLFPQQWHLLNSGSTGGVFDADLDADQAWDITTGSVTPAGDTVVIAVIDGGIDASHPDLFPNLWYNRAEIPNNGLDDDDNGFVDDYRGWNVFSENDNIQGNNTAHGTPVAAMLGAKGNNGTGVSGVIWDARMMFVAASGSESEILAAYDYVLKTRQRYNESWGTNGAFVVAVNCSWGINYGQPSESPLWCEAFDQLGAVGIVSVAATANLPVNVDEVGDLPTACPSNFLISVTSLNSSDEKAANAAWGELNIDLGAYGQEVYTAATGGGFGYFSGTSFAAPEVAGAVGLLYAAPCPNLIALAKTDPAAAAYWVKSLILENVTPNPALNGKTFTDGRLNLYRVLEDYENQCSSCPPPFALSAQVVSDTTALLAWINPVSASSVALRWRAVGQGAWNYAQDLLNAFELPGLSVCTSYEFEVQAFCVGTVASAWSQPFVFQTEGCCVAPTSVWLENLTSDVAKIAWQATSFNNTYRLRMRESGNNPWMYFEAETNSFDFYELKQCQEYQVQVQARCEDVLTNYTPVLAFQTKGCGSCNELEYCALSGINATEEWISSLKIGDWIYASGAGGSGYQNFNTTQSSFPPLRSENTIHVVVTPGFSGNVVKEYFRIYVDFNQDGDFDDPDELAFDPGFALEGPAEGQLHVPFLQSSGITRLRVMMKYTTPNDPPPSSCTSFDFGQVEDYCAELKKDSVPTAINDPAAAAALHIYPQPAVDAVWLDWKGAAETADLRVWDMQGRSVFVQNKLSLPNGRLQIDTHTWAPGLYAIEIRSEGKILRGSALKL